MGFDRRGSRGMGIDDEADDDSDVRGIINCLSHALMHDQPQNQLTIQVVWTKMSNVVINKGRVVEWHTRWT